MATCYLPNALAITISSVKTSIIIAFKKRDTDPNSKHYLQRGTHIVKLVNHHTHTQDDHCQLGGVVLLYYVLLSTLSLVRSEH